MQRVTQRVTVDCDDIRAAIGRVQALGCAHPHCPGEDEPYEPGVTCLRCHALQQMSSWLPEGERVSGISDEDADEIAETCRECGEEYPQAGDGWDGLCPGCADVNGSDLCDRCMMSGKEIAYTDPDGDTVCVECAEDDHDPSNCSGCDEMTCKCLHLEPR